MSLTVGPSVSVTPQEGRILMGGNITFVCKVTSDPLAVIRWEKDNVQVKNSDDSELTIVNLHPDDTGQYTCFASNYLDKANASAVLLVIGNRLTLSD